MGSNLFINYSLGLINICYKILGVKLTNFAVNNSVASIFTSGETIRSLVRDIDEYEKQNIKSIAGYVVEGLPVMDEARISQFYNDMFESIDAQTEGKSEAHFALKFTALISTDIMTRLSRAQNVYMDSILKYNKQEMIDISDLRNSLLERGINFTQKELQGLFDSLKFPGN